MLKDTKDISCSVFIDDDPTKMIKFQDLKSISIFVIMKLSSIWQSYFAQFFIEKVF